MVLDEREGYGTDENIRRSGSIITRRPEESIITILRLSMVERDNEKLYSDNESAPIGRSPDPLSFHSYWSDAARHDTPR